MITTYWLTSLLALSMSAFDTTTAFTPQLPHVARRVTETKLPYLVDHIDVAVDNTPLLSPIESRILPTLPLPTISTLMDVELSFLPTATNDGTVHSYPVVVTPKQDNSIRFLKSFASNNKHWIDSILLKHGAILFRGFEIHSAPDVESAIKSLEPNLNKQYRGTSPRKTQPGTEYVFSAAEVSATWPISQHIEMSFLPSPPKRLFFSALKAPKSVGGETALADFRKVYNDLPSKLRNKLQSKKLRYTRTHHRTGANPRFTSDVASMQSWADVFGTSDKLEIERLAAAEKLPMKWTGRNKDTFVSQFISEPFQLHPISKEPVFFNHAQVFHYTSFAAELLFAFRRTKEWRFLARGLWSAASSFVTHGLLRRKMALQVSFGDGTPISAWEMHQIRKAIHKNMVFSRWEKGDLLMIDNFSTSHGRQPTYDTGRQVVVSWSDPIEKANELQ